MTYFPQVLSRVQEDALARRTAGTNKLPLRRYHRVLATVASTSVDILVIGDSVTEGKASTRPLRYVAQMLARIRRNWQPAGVTGGEGYIPAYYVVTGVTSPWTKTGSTSNVADMGLGRRVTRLGAAATASLAFTGTRVRLFYAKRPAGGDFTVQIDGGAATTLNALSGTDAGGFTWDSADLTAGAHTLLVTAVGGVAIEGAMVFNGDVAAGIHMWEAAHSGYTTADFLTAAAPTVLTSVTATGADLILINLALNDYSLGTSIATYLSNLRSIISAHRGAFTNQPSVVLIIPHKRLATTSPIAPWDAYVDAIYQLVAEDGNLGVVDLNARFGPNASGSGLGLLDVDDVHLTDAGHAFTANIIAGYLEP